MYSKSMMVEKFEKEIALPLEIHVIELLSLVFNTGNRNTLLSCRTEVEFRSKASRDGQGAAIYAPGNQLPNNQNIGPFVSFVFDIIDNIETTFSIKTCRLLIIHADYL